MFNYTSANEDTNPWYPLDFGDEPVRRNEHLQGISFTDPTAELA